MSLICALFTYGPEAGKQMRGTALCRLYSPEGSAGNAQLFLPVW